MPHRRPRAAVAMHPKSVVIPGWNKLDARWCQTQREAYLSATTIRHVPRNSPCRETTKDSVSEKARAGVGGVHGDDGSRDTADARSNRDLSETDDTVSDDDVLEAILMTDSEPEETDADPDNTDEDDDPTWDPNHAHTSKTSTTAIDDDDDSETEEEDVERKGEIARPAANAAGGNIAPPSASRQDASGGTVGILVEGGGKSRQKSQKQDSPSRRFIGVGNFKNITGERGGRPYYATISVKREDGKQECTYLGAYHTAEEAAAAYNKRALELGRKRLNVIEDVQLRSGGSSPEAKRARSSPSPPCLVDVSRRTPSPAPSPLTAPLTAPVTALVAALAPLPTPTPAPAPAPAPTPTPVPALTSAPTVAPAPTPAPELALTLKPKDEDDVVVIALEATIDRLRALSREVDRSRVTFRRDMALARAAAASAERAEMDATDPNGVGSVSERSVASSRARAIRDEKYAAAYDSLAAHFRASRDYNEAAAEAEEAEEARTRSDLGRSTR